MIRLILILIFIVPQFAFGQQRTIPLNISIFNESTAIPFTKLITNPIHPGIQIGTEFVYKEKAHFRLFQTANLAYFFHNHLTQGIGLSTELGYEYRLKQRFSFSALLGIGYMHTFATTEEYVLNNGQYVKKPDRGNARFTPSVSFEIGYSLNKAKLQSPQLFVQYQSWAEYPYSPDFIPVMTHINLHIGAKMFLKTKKQKHE